MYTSPPMAIVCAGNGMPDQETTRDTARKVCGKCGSARLRRSGKADSSRRQRWHCASCGHRTTNPSATADEQVEFKSRLPDKKRFVITAAQNATPVFKPFLAALLRYCKANDAALIVIPYRYKNPTSQWNENNEDYEWWAEDVTPYLYDGRFNLNDNLVVMADVKVQPTAVTPLSGLDSMTGHRSGIVGHPRVELKTVATPSHKLPKIMTTSGAVTRPNYTDSKAGKKGEFHHSYAAVVAEISGKTFHLRQLSACRDGSFIDLDREYTKDCVRKAPPAEALVMGDIHVDFVDPEVVKATFKGPRSIMATLKPKRVVLHDLLDFYSRNHHHAKNPFVNIAKRNSSMDVVQAEIARACRFIDDNIPSATKVVLVPSNHVEALARWISDADWRQDPINAEAYLETALAVVRSIKMTPNGSSMIDPFHYWAKKLLRTKARCIYLNRSDSYQVRDIELSMHGDQGVNGARASRKSLSTIGVKSIFAHGHGPGITDGAMQVGTSSRLRLEYNGGPSNWLNTHGAIYANGKRCLMNIIHGEFRA